MTINDRMNRIRERFLKKQRKEKLTNVSFTLTRTYVLVILIFFFFSLLFVAKCAAIFKYVWGKKKRKTYISPFMA